MPQVSVRQKEPAQTMQMSKEDCRCLDVEESGRPHGLWFLKAKDVSTRTKAYDLLLFEAYHRRKSSVKWMTFVHTVSKANEL